MLTPFNQRIYFLILFSVFVCLPCYSQEQASSADESISSSSEKTSYIYDLRALIDKSRSNIKRVNEKIKEQAIYKRNLQREEKAREYYDRAMVLFDEGKIDEARDLFEKSIRITEHPEMKDYIKVSEKKFKSQAVAMRKEERERVALTVEQEKEKQEQVRNSYQDGERFFKMQNYKAARDEFILVEQLIPEYKATRSYLKLLEEKIAQQDQVDLIKQKKEIVRQQKEADETRLKEKELWYKELEFKEQERQRKLQEQAKKVYAEAMNAYKKKEFITAKEKFQEVEWVLPDYRSTRGYLERIDKAIEEKEAEFDAKEREDRAKKEWDDVLNQQKVLAQAKKDFEKKSSQERSEAIQTAAIHYQNGIDLLGQKKYSESRDEFLAVQKIHPDFKGTSTYLSRLNNELGIIETAPNKVADLVRGLYAKALEDFNRKDYGAAKLKFEQIEFMYPDYLATRKYLGKLTKQIDKKLLEVSEEERLKDAADNAAVVDSPVDVDKQAYQNLIDQAEPLYVKAVALFDEKEFDEALRQFEAVEKALPNYKATRPYLKRVAHQIKRIEQQRFKEEQMQQAQTINFLAKQANILYNKILLLVDDRATSGAQKKFALVDRLFAHMSKEQARLLEEIAQEEERLRLEEIAYEQEVQRSEFTNAIDPIYQEAVRLYRAQKYDEAKAKFLEAQSTIADYRSSARYLNLIEKQNQLLQQTIKDRESQIAEFKLKAAENAELAAKLQLKAQESAMIRDLVGQAEAINDEIVVLAKDKNFEAIKEKFVQLEKIVDSLLTIKTESAAREDREKQSKYRKSRESKSDIEVKEQEAENKNEKDSLKNEPSLDDSDQVNIKEEQEKIERNRVMQEKIQLQNSKEEQLKLQKEKADQQAKLRQIEKEQRAAFQRAVDFYNAKKYAEAKTQFVALEQSTKYVRSAKKYVEKIDRLVLEQQNQQVLKMDKQREEYLQERAERDRMAFRIKEANRDNKIQTAPTVQMSSPAVVPTPQYPTTRQQYLSSLNLRVKRPVVLEIADQNQISQMKSAENVGSRNSVEKKVQNDEETTKPSPEGVSPNEDGSWLQRRNQKKLSDRRKKYIESRQRAKEKKEAQKKAEAEQKLKESRIKAEELHLRTAERQRVEREAKLQKSREIQSRARLQIQNLRKAKSASASSNRQVIQEEKLRKMYAQELKGTKAGSGFDNAIAALEKQKNEQARLEMRRQKSFLKQQMEDEKSLRDEKIRKIDTIINQSQSNKLPLRGKKSQEPLAGNSDVNQISRDDSNRIHSARSEAKYTVKVTKSRESRNNDLLDKSIQSKEDSTDKDMVRRKFENGLAKMYSEAVGYYRRHMYKEARDRFSDVEDISPNYKRTRTYLSRIQNEILNEQKRRAKQKEEKQYNAIQQVDIPRIQKVNSMIPSPSTPVADRLDAVSQALDAFETQSK